MNKRNDIENQKILTLFFPSFPKSYLTPAIGTLLLDIDPVPEALFMEFVFAL